MAAPASTAGTLGGSNHRSPDAPIDAEALGPRVELRARLFSCHRVSENAKCRKLAFREGLLSATRRKGVIGRAGVYDGVLGTPLEDGAVGVVGAVAGEVLSCRTQVTLAADLLHVAPERGLVPFFRHAVPPLLAPLSPAGFPDGLGTFVSTISGALGNRKGCVPGFREGILSTTRAYCSARRG